MKSATSSLVLWGLVNDLDIISRPFQLAQIQNSPNRRGALPSWVKNKRSIVVRVVLLANTWLAMARSTGLETSGMEGIDRRVSCIILSKHFSQNGQYMSVYPQH
jgi:hypothetical protein